MGWRKRDGIKSKRAREEKKERERERERVEEGGRYHLMSCRRASPQLL